MNQPTECCEKCKSPVYNHLTNTVMFYKCGNAACPCHATKPTVEVCGADTHPGGPTNSLPVGCQNPLPCPLHDKPSGGWEEEFRAWWNIEYAGSMRSPDPAMDYIAKLIAQARREELQMMWKNNEVMHGLELDVYIQDRLKALTH